MRRQKLQLRAAPSRKTTMPRITTLAISRLTRARSTPLKQQDSGWDLFKFFGASITILGIIAWIAGRMYWWGYWDAAGFPAPPIEQSMQETALAGFVMPFKAWFYAIPILFFSGIYVLLLGVNFRKAHPSTQPKNVFSMWIRRKFVYDMSVGRIGFGLVFTSIGMVLMLLSLSIWVAAAGNYGSMGFKEIFCTSVPDNSTTIQLGNEQAISGRILSHSTKEKQSIILSKKEIQIVSGDPAKVLLTVRPNPRMCSTK